MAPRAMSAIFGGFWERWSQRSATAALIVVWFCLALAGYLVLSSVLSSRLYDEVGVLTNKLARQVGGMGVLGLGGAATLYAGWTLRALIIRRRQRRNDRIAARLMEALRADPEAAVPEFFVYLRAFETTGRLNVPLYLRLMKLMAFAHLTPNDLESYLSGAVRRYRPVVALGQPGEAYGSGRVPASEQQWKEDMLVLLRRCRGIFLIPSHRSGTRWEVETIRDHGLLEKCVFVMPSRSRKIIDTQERWRLAQESLREVGLELPDYVPSGLLFEFGKAGGQVSNVEPLLFGRSMRKAIERVLSDRLPAGGLFAAIARADRKARRARLFGWLNVAYHWLPVPLAAASFLVPAMPEPPAGESWEITWSRSRAYGEMSKWELAGPPANQDLLKLTDDELRRFYTAQAHMLERLDTPTCAAMAPGGIDIDTGRHAFSYIPENEIEGFLSAWASALSPEVKQRPAPPLDPEAMEKAGEHFFALLTPGQRERWIRLADGNAQASPEEQCWAARVLYGSVERLDEHHSGPWARFIASMALQENQQQAALGASPSGHPPGSPLPPASSSPDQSVGSQLIAQREEELRQERLRIASEDRRRQQAQREAQEREIQRQKEQDALRQQELEGQRKALEELRAKQEEQQRQIEDARRKLEEEKARREREEQARMEAARVPVAPPEPIARPKPGQPSYSGPSTGEIVWEGTLRGTELITIENGQASSGTVTGSLPGVPCLIQPTDPRKVSIASAPGPRNQYNRLVIRVSGNGRTRVTMKWSLP